jgi:hypothetical protein
MPLQHIELPAGVSREGTSYSDTGRWYDCNLIRFRRNAVEKIGGWVKHTSETFSGIAKHLRRFSVNSGETYTMIGTSSNLYLETGGTLDDISPVRATSLNENNCFTSTDTLSILTVTDVAHGALVGDVVWIQSAATFNGVNAASINTYHTILTTPTADTFTIDTGDVASASGAGGGAATDIYYLVNPGGDGYPGGAGWGASVWGRGTWGSAADISSLPGGGYGAHWTLETYGEDVIAVPRFGTPYYWDASSPTTRAAALSTLGGASNTPTKVVKLLVSPKSRHVVAFGVNALGETAIDRMLVRWSDNEDAANWTPSTTVTAGDQRLTRGSTVITALPTRDAMLIWTDTSLYGMTWIGGEFVFSIDLLSEKTNIAGFQSATMLNDSVYWMGRNGFYRFNGIVDTLQCEVHDYIQSDVDWEFADNIYAGTSIGFHEIIWFYVSNDSPDGQCDKYVVYQEEANIWYYGELARTCWTDRTFTPWPLAASTDGYLYSHELGSDDGSEDPAVPLEAYVESAPFEIGNGDGYSFITRVIHDVTFRDSEDATNQMNVVLKTSNYPGAALTATSTNEVERSAVMPVEQYTTQSFVRMRGRQFKLRAESDTLGSMWRLGRPRVELRTDGRKS